MTRGDGLPALQHERCKLDRRKHGETGQDLGLGTGRAGWCILRWKTDNVASQDLFYVRVANSKPLPLRPAAELAGECADTQSSQNDNREDLGHPLCFPTLGRTTPQSFHGDDNLAYCQKTSPGSGHWSFFMFWTIPPLNPFSFPVQESLTL